MKTKINFIILSFGILSSLSFAQIEQYSPIEIQNNDHLLQYSEIVAVSENEFIVFWADSSNLIMGKFNTTSSTWSESVTLREDLDEMNPNLSALLLSNGRLLLSFKVDGHYLLYSEDYGETWSDEIYLDVGGVQLSRYLETPKLVELYPDKIWYIFKLQSKAGFIESSNGITWTEEAKELHPVSGTFYNDIVSDNNKLLLVYNRYYNQQLNTFYRISSDTGKTWTPPIQLVNFEKDATNLDLVKTADNKIYLVYSNSGESSPYTPFPEVDVFYRTTTDFGENWNEEIRVTNYAGPDVKPSVTAFGDQIFVSFASNRCDLLYPRNWRNNPYTFTQFFGIADFLHDGYLNHIYFGSLLNSTDLLVPPLIHTITTEYNISYPNSSILSEFYITDDESIETVELTYSVSGGSENTVELFDNGVFPDSTTDDNIYSFSLENFSVYDTVNMNLVVSDNLGNITRTNPFNVIVRFQEVNKVTLFDVNNITMPINNEGELGSRYYYNDGSEIEGALFNDMQVLFRGGFYLSGTLNDDIWSFANASSSRDQHTVPGKVSSDPDNNQNIVYVVKSSDPPFGETWQIWKFAVDNGAKYYDGDGNGIYNPIDHNQNGLWDPGEDRPDLIGDYTAWCVYNDGLAPELRSFHNTDPLGIEIRQTVFGYNHDIIKELNRTVFIRYEIENTGLVSDLLDSVHFSVWDDPDLAEYHNDLPGSDIELSAGYVYDNPKYSEDNNSPAFFATILGGPQSFIPGVTFTDNNQNGMFDEGIDTPLDSAVINYGENLGTVIIPGAKNLPATSFVHIIHSHPTLGDPSTEIEAWNYMHGYNKKGNEINPCNWEFGKVLGDVDCESVNPFFWYNGDPVSETGWVSKINSDQVTFLNTGPFQLKTGEPRTIIAAYCVGKGATSLESVNTGKRIVKNIRGFYSTNFSYVPTSNDETTDNQLPTTFKLEQNYPNPFNPSTKIKYTIAPLSGGLPAERVA